LTWLPRVIFSQPPCQQQTSFLLPRPSLPVSPMATECTLPTHARLTFLCCHLVQARLTLYQAWPCTCSNPLSQCATRDAVTFSKIGCTIVYHGRTIICGHKCTRTGLWMIPLAEITTLPTSMPTTSPISIKLAANIDTTSLATKYAQCVHQLLCSPPAATLLLALNKSTEPQTIPGLTPALICAHLPQSIATDKGHMRRHRSNTASTCKKAC
jgi:hypothetical protein